MPVFEDRDNAPQHPPLRAGDYMFRVEELTCKTSTGAKTKGCDQYDIKFAIEGHPNVIFDALIDHETCAWKIDTFLKCAGVKIAKGQAWEFNKARADKKRWLWVNPEGLRGWCHIVQETVLDRDTKQPKLGADGKPQVRNRIKLYYTDKQKLPPYIPNVGHDAPPAPEAPAEDGDDAPF